MTGDLTGDLTGDRPGGDDTHGDDPGRPARPPLRLVRGDATPEEIAALLAVLAAAGADEPDPAPAPRSAWGSRQRALRRPLHPGPRAWQRSGFPG